MTRTTKRTIFFSLLGLIAIGAGVAFYLYNKGLIDVDRASPDIKVTSVELYRAFSTDSVAANKKFSRKDEIVEVTGTVSAISKNQQNNAVIALKTNEADAFINCTMLGPSGTVKEGDTIVLKGICIGINSDLGILGDVYMIRCYQGKQK